MRHQRGVAFAVVALALMLIGLATPAHRASAQGDSLQLVSATYYIVQGESDLIAGSESVNDFSFLKIMTFELPYNVSRVYSSVPSDARNLTTWVASKGLINTSSGWETSGSMAGKLYIDVPSWYERDATSTNTTNNSQSFLAPGSVLTNLSYSSGALRLVAGASDGIYVSAQIEVPEIINILSVNLTLYGTDLQNVTSQVSNDHGSSWTTAVPGTEAELASSGTALHVRLGFQGNESTPLVTGFEAAIRYILPSTSFTVHITYVWPGQFDEGKLVLDLTEPIPYMTGGASFVWLYLVKGYSAEGTGIALNLDEDGDPTEPTKTVYVNMSFSPGGSASRSIQVIEPETDWTWFIVLGFCGAVIAIGVFVLRRRRPESAEMADLASPSECAQPEEPAEDLAKKKAELVARKKEIAAELEALESRKTSRALGAEEAAAKSEALKSEARKVRNELNRVSRKIARAEDRGPDTESEDSYDSVLSAIARLDEDHEKGRLPEETYRSLRKEYTARAAEMLASRESFSVTEDPLETEKTKLMEAIVALEEEHERGKVDARVYEDLRSSYRKELAALLQRMDESEEE